MNIDQQIIDLMRTKSDRYIFENHNIPIWKLKDIRKKLNIKRPPRERLKKLTDKEKTNLYSLLGKKSDVQIGKQFGVHTSHVNILRNELKIKPVQEKKYNRLTEQQKTDMVLLLGKKADWSLSKQFGISHETVRKYRMKYGIDTYRNMQSRTHEETKTNDYIL